jgi:cell division protein FtsI (penicillin-binding protein 3)
MKSARVSVPRLAVLFFLIIAGWIAVLVRFVQIQIVEGARYDNLVAEQCWGELQLSARRGAIYDCRNNVLAFDIPKESFFTYAGDPATLREIGRVVSKVTGEKGLVKRLLERPGQYNSLVKCADPDLASRIAALDLDSVRSNVEYRRLYPFGTLGVDYLGQVNVDNIGVSGLEVALNEDLKAHPGLAAFQRDGKGRVYRLSDRPVVHPADGCDVTLTVDHEYQQIAEEELREAVNKWTAKAGMVVLIEVKSGRILAADYYCPSEDSNAVENVFKSRLVTDLFEPGSTFKLVAFAGMLDQELYPLHATTYAGMGEFQFNGRTLHDDKPHGEISLRRAFELSSNIATARFSQKLAGKLLYKYARDFGFGQPPETGLPEEERGRLVKPRNFTDFWTAQVSIGHGVSVTAMQMAVAFATVANDGMMMQPYLVEEIRNDSRRTTQRSIQHEVRRVISVKAARVLQDLMGGVVDSGTAKAARLDDVSFGGKTGTAQKPNLSTGGYYQDRYMASFGGFYPRENPRVAGIVVLDDPQPVHYGGYTTGPVFAEIARRTTLLEKTRNGWIAESAGNRATAPSSVPRQSAKSQHGLDSVPDFGNIAQWIDGKSTGKQSQILERRMMACADSVFAGIVPDFSGLSVREALSLLEGSGCRIRVIGNGLVESQFPCTGIAIADLDTLLLDCSPSKGGKDETQRATEDSTSKGSHRQR